MVRIAMISGNANCPPNNPLLSATVTVEQVTDFCVRLTIENDEDSAGSIGFFCLDVNNTGDFVVIGPGQVQVQCPGACDINANISRNFTSDAEKVDPGEDAEWIICSDEPLTEEQFERVALFFQEIEGCPEEDDSECLADNFMDMTTSTTSSTTSTTSSTTSTTSSTTSTTSSTTSTTSSTTSTTSSTTSTTSTTSSTTTTSTTTSTTSTTTTTTVCPIPNPQTCCQHVVEFKTQIVPPTLGGIENVETDVFFSDPPVVEDVCPEKVIICGKLTKVIRYTAVADDGAQTQNMLTDERSFQCVIDRDDANEGDEFDVVGFDVLCEGTPRLQNRGTRPVGASSTGTVNVFWKLLEKDIIKVCIRKHI
ncbi:hypothetical protein ACFQ3N_11125 [Virgibacillus byunsanensis]|uniref:Uncharacterized protein n=1 Tax=Virgibacillus byunsanensis TaxID=570945 RepID=A0ABW3LMA3_9BACI